MKLKDLFEEQRIIKGNVSIDAPASTLKGRKVGGIPIANAIIKGDFSCEYTFIKSLKGAPSHVKGNFDCSNTQIKSLKGAPSHVNGDFDCSYTNIASLHDVHKQIKYIGGVLYLPNTTKSHILGVMFIKGLKAITFVADNDRLVPIEVIFNKYLPGGNPHGCQEELIDAGLSEYAKL